MLNKIDELNSSKASFYEQLCGAESIKALVEKFYDIMDTDAVAAPIRAMHPTDLTSSREKLYLFLTGWTGGPQLYIEQYGHPMLRRRHLRFAIDDAARDQWMYCMVKAMHELKFEEPLMTALAGQLYAVADFMRNHA